MDYLLKQAKRCNFNLFITAVIVLAVAALLALIPINDYYMSFDSDKEVDIQRVKANAYTIGLFSDFYYIKSDKCIDLGTEPYIIDIKIGSKIKNTNDDDDFLLVKSGEYWLPVTVPDKERKNTARYHGKLAGINDREFEELKKRASKIDEKIDTEKILNTRLNTVVSRAPWTNAAFWISIVLFFAFLIILIKVIRRTLDIYKSPVLSNLVIYGDINQIEQSINKEMEFGESNVYGKIIITGKWLLIKRLYTVDMAPLSDIVWIYTKARWKRYKSIIPLYKTTVLNVIIRNGLHFEAELLTKSKAEELIDKIITMRQWIITGYSKEIKKLYKADFESLVKQVDDKRISLGYHV